MKGTGRGYLISTELTKTKNTSKDFDLKVASFVSFFDQKCSVINNVKKLEEEQIKV